MSKYSIKKLWDEIYGKQEEVHDYAGRLMLKSACGNPYSRFEPTIDHIRPRSAGGKDVKGNVVICHWKTNEEKGNCFPHWQTNGYRFRAERESGSEIKYRIVKEQKKEVQHVQEVPKLVFKY